MPAWLLAWMTAGCWRVAGGVYSLSRDSSGKALGCRTRRACLLWRPYNFGRRRAFAHSHSITVTVWHLNISHSHTLNHGVTPMFRASFRLSATSCKGLTPSMLLVPETLSFVTAEEVTEREWLWLWFGTSVLFDLGKSRAWASLALLHHHSHCLTLRLSFFSLYPAPHVPPSFGRG